MHGEAKRFYESQGHLRVPAGFETANGKRLDRWVNRQKQDQKRGELPPGRIARLEAIGIAWAKDSWEERYALAKAFYEANGHLNVPSQYKAEGNIWLGKWLYEQRMAYWGRTDGKSLTLKQAERLEEVGMVWDVGGKPVKGKRESWARVGSVRQAEGIYTSLLSNQEGSTENVQHFI